MKHKISIFFLLIILLNGCSTKANQSPFTPTEIDSYSTNTLYKLNVPNLFDTLTVFITKDKIKDYRAVSYFKRIAKYTGDTNIATNVSYGFANKRYKDTMKHVKNCGDINPNNLPLVLFYIKNDETCHKFNYSNYEEFQGIMDFTAQQLEKVAINPTDITKFQMKQVIRDYAQANNLSKTLTDTIEILLDNIFTLIPNKNV